MSAGSSFLRAARDHGRWGKPRPCRSIPSQMARKPQAIHRRLKEALLRPQAFALLLHQLFGPIPVPRCLTSRPAVGSAESTPGAARPRPHRAVHILGDRIKSLAMEGDHFPGQILNPFTGQAWNPGTEIHPGGPHPGAIIDQIERERAQQEATLRAKRLAKKRHLLLQR